MSWQRILELARRRGMPVVVTDLAGREAMVVMPFDEYERLSETAHVSERTTNREFSKARPEPVREEVPLPQSSRTPDADNGSLGDLMEAISVPPQEKNADMSLEERFYLEPVDEDNDD